MATFGNEAARSATLFLGAADCARSLFTLPEDGDIESVSVIVNLPDADYAAVRCVIYSDAGVHLAESADVWDVAAGGWQTLTIPVTLEAAAGDYYLAVQIQHDSIQIGSIAEASGAGINVDDGNTWGTAAPDPFVTGYSRPDNEQLCIYATYTAASIGAEIVSINGSEPIVAGGDITAVTSTLSATGMTVGGLSVDDFTAVGGDNYTATMPWFVDGGSYPDFGSVTVVMTDGVNSPELSKTLALPATWTSIAVASLSADEDSLSGHPDSPLTIEIGGSIVYPNETITFYDDTTFSDAPTGSVTAWYRSPENIMTEITIINGEIDSVGGITMRELTASALTMRNLTMRSL